jgi:catechol 2,3-dioxygenase-like lactoylglutathione lyase family enzyme
MLFPSMRISILFSFLVAMVAPAPAQLAAPNATGVAMGHYHLVVKDVEAQKRFWSSVGGKPVQNGQLNLIQFPGVFVMLRQGDPKAGTEGSTVNHFGFNVKNAKDSRAKWEAAGLKIINGGRPEQFYLMGPDDVKVEIIEDQSIVGPIANHHIHFWTASVDDTKAWYVKTFGAKPGKRGAAEAADLPGVNLTFALAKDPVVGTKGRSLDHIGFEVRNLEQFCKNLEAAGIKLDQPYRKLPNSNTAIAFFTDPWGTYIELTEGLAPASL